MSSRLLRPVYLALFIHEMSSDNNIKLQTLDCNENVLFLFLSLFQATYYITKWNIYIVKTSFSAEILVRLKQMLPSGFLH